MLNRRQLVPIALIKLTAVAPAVLPAQVPSAVTITASATAIPDLQAAALSAIPVLSADSANAASLARISDADIVRAKKALAELRAKLAEIETKVKELMAQVDSLKAEIAKLERAIKELEEKKAKAIAEVKDAKASLDLMRRITSERTAAQQLLDAMRQRNATLLAGLLATGTSTATIAAIETPAADVIKMVFRVGALAQCIATKALCGTGKYALVK